MFRISRFGFGIAKKARIPLKTKTGQLLMPNFCRMYRREMKPSQSVTFEAQDLGNDLEVLEEDEFEETIPKRIVTEVLPKVVDVILSQGKEINWDKVIEESLKATKRHNFDKEIMKGHIVRACELNRLFPALTSYLKYLIENKELCVGMLYIICGVIKNHPTELSECIDMIYEVKKGLLPEQGIALSLCITALVRSPKYRSILLNKTGDILNHGIYKEQLAHYFNYGDVDGAFKLLSSGKCDKIVSFIPRFLNYFEDCVESGEKIPVSRIVLLFDTLAKNCSLLSNEHINILTELMSKLNVVDKAYMWFCKPAEIGKYCKLCSGELKRVNISQEEIDVLKVEVEKNVIYGQNINIRSTREEWKSFVQFIKKKPYDIVIDGLNVWCAFLKDPQPFSNLLRHLEERELTPLTVARKHFVSSSAYNMIHNKYPFFLAADLSHDDVFAMYAALHKGKGCYLMTNDQMGFAKTAIGSPNLEEMFLRWQASHQCYASRRGIIFPHSLAVGMQKSPSRDKQEFRYHLVVKDSSYRKMYCISRLKR